MRTYFKFISPHRTSIIMDGHFQTHYPFKKWTKSPIEGTPLMVFRDMESALNAGQEHKWQGHVVRCHIKPWRGVKRFHVVPQEYLRYVTSAAGWRDVVLKLWQGQEVPDGTVLASAVYCLD